MLETFKIPVTTTGSNGAASGDGYSDRPINGEVRAVVVDWHASAPNTSDITVVVEADGNHPSITLYSKTNANTDVTVYPKVQNTDINGGAIAAQYQHIVAAGRVKVSVADCDALPSAVTVYLFVWR